MDSSSRSQTARLPKRWRDVVPKHVNEGHTAALSKQISLVTRQLQNELESLERVKHYLESKKKEPDDGSMSLPGLASSRTASARGSSRQTGLKSAALQISRPHVHVPTSSSPTARGRDVLLQSDLYGVVLQQMVQQLLRRSRQAGGGQPSDAFCLSELYAEGAMAHHVPLLR